MMLRDRETDPVAKGHGFEHRVASCTAGLNASHLQRILIVLAVLSLTLAGCGAPMEPDPNAFHPRHILEALAGLVKTVWQLLLNPETRWVVILLLIGIFVEVGRRIQRRR